MFTIRLGASWNGGNPTGGTWAHSLGGGLEGPPALSWAWPVGCKTASWSLAVPRGFAHPALRRGALVEVYDAGLRVWMGQLTEPDPTSTSYDAQGLGMRFDKVAGIVSTGSAHDASTNPYAVAVAAQARGWRFTVGSTVPDESLLVAAETAQRDNPLSELLTEYQTRTGRRWAVDENGLLSCTLPDTVATVVLVPGTPSIPTADDDYASQRFGRYVSGVSGSPAQPSQWAYVASPTDPTAPNADADRWGPAEVVDDLTGSGLLFEPDAQDLEDLLYDDNRARPAYTRSLEVPLTQVTTLGGVPWHPTLLRPGAIVRQQGVYDTEGRYGSGNEGEWVLGEVSYDGGQTVVLTPTGLAARTARAITAALATTGGFE